MSIKRLVEGFSKRTSLFGLAVLASGSLLAAPDVQVIPLHLDASGKTGFERLDAEAAGIRFGPATFNDINSIPLHVMSPGLAAGDFDGDGLIDLMFCRLNGASALFKNLGNWKFEDVSKQAGLNLAGRPSYGAMFSDIEGDGDLDLFILSLNSYSILYINDGKGHFTEKKDMAWVKPERGGDVTAAMADIDGDGDLDLYTTRYPQVLLKYLVTPEEYSDMVEGARKMLYEGELPPSDFLNRFMIFSYWDGKNMTYRFEEQGVRDELYINEGNGNFRAVKDDEGRFRNEDGEVIPMPADWGLAATFRDIDQDGDPDLFVCNDFLSPERMWINDGKGNFQLAPRLTLRRTSWFSMGADFADFNRDGYLDFFEVDMRSRSHVRRKVQMGDMDPTPIVIGQIEDRPQFMQNTMFLNRGDGTFTEISNLAGVKASEWSWCPIFLDVDLDGYEDLLISNGMEYDLMDSDAVNDFKRLGKLSREDAIAARRRLSPPLNTANVIFRNNKDLTFTDVSSEWGFTIETVTGGMVVADLDNDGDLDVIGNNTEAYPTELYRNETIAPRIAVRLKGAGANTQGAGAHIRLLGGKVEQSQEVVVGGSYSSGSDPKRTFAAEIGTDHTIEVVWRSGKRTVVKGVKANNEYVISESGAEDYQPPAKPTPKPMFVDVSDRLGHKHEEAPFDDFKRQSLLPNRLSQLGPGLSWYDVDQDGDDDLVIGSGRGGKLHVFENDGKGGFSDHESPPLNIEQTTLLGAVDQDGNSLVWAGLSNYEDGSAELPAAQSFSFAEGRRWYLGEGIPGVESSTGPLSMADVDGDGDLDLFVGGRVIPGSYPKRATSRLFLNDQGKWRQDTRNQHLFDELGMVCGSAFGDLDGDGDADLVLALEWGPVKVYLNDGGALTDATDAFGLGDQEGWWNGVTLGDFDGDGRLDIAASNWGRNSKYNNSYSYEHPLQVLFADLDDSGTFDIVEAHFDKKMGFLVPERGRSCSSRAMPFIAEKLPTFHSFATGSLQDIYGDKLAKAQELSARTLDHTVFLNRGKTFEVKTLPLWSQLAPGFGIGVADFNGDGREDLFMSQNFFAVQNETPRNDGGRGILLLGQGNGEFEPVKGQDSGILIYGEQRGSALSDFDGDGRVDVVVSQNGAETKLYRNVSGEPGLRVRLRGTKLNPTGVGAVLRMKTAAGEGPAKIVMAGSGYWSQDSAVKIFTHVGDAASLRVRWPDGRETTSKVPAGAGEIVVSTDGKVDVIR